MRKCNNFMANMNVIWNVVDYYVVGSDFLGVQSELRGYEISLATSNAPIRSPIRVGAATNSVSQFGAKLVLN